MLFKRLAVATAFLSIICIATEKTATANDLIIVSTKATYEASQEWVDFLTLNEVPVHHVTPQEFYKYKKESYIVIMGGLDEPGGIKILAAEILAEDEFEYVSKKGNGEIYFKFQVFDPMQTIIVFAGSDWSAAAAARKKSRDDWLNTFISWFNLDIEMGGGLHVY